MAARGRTWFVCQRVRTKPGKNRKKHSPAILHIAVQSLTRGRKTSLYSRQFSLFSFVTNVCIYSCCYLLGQGVLLHVIELVWALLAGSEVVVGGGGGTCLQPIPRACPLYRPGAYFIQLNISLVQTNVNGIYTIGWVNLYKKFEIEKYTVCGKLILPKKLKGILLNFFLAQLACKCSWICKYLQASCIQHF